EISIRKAIGASGLQASRQILTESLLLTLLGNTLGFCFYWWSMRLLAAFSPGNLPRINEKPHPGTFVSVFDWQILCFALVVTFSTALLFAFLPTLYVSRTNITTSLKESSGRSGTGLRHNRFRSVLVVAEIALALILLTGATLMIRTFVALHNT